MRNKRKQVYFWSVNLKCAECGNDAEFCWMTKDHIVVKDLCRVCDQMLKRPPELETGWCGSIGLEEGTYKEYKEHIKNIKRQKKKEKKIK